MPAGGKAACGAGGLHGVAKAWGQPGGKAPGAWSPPLLVSLPASTGARFLPPPETPITTFREQKLPVSVQGLYSEALHKPVCLESQFSFQGPALKLSFQTWRSRRAAGRSFLGALRPDGRCGGSVTGPRPRASPPLPSFPRPC